MNKIVLLSMLLLVSCVNQIQVGLFKKPIAGAETAASGVTSLTNLKFFSEMDPDGLEGRELYVSDGTVAGTKRLKAIAQGWLDSNPTYFTKTSHGIIFTADDSTLAMDGETTIPVHGNELWITDGTESGTKLLKDLCPGDCSPRFAGDFFKLNNLVYFTITLDDTGYELWVTDGTETGTKMVKDINPGVNSSTPSNFFQFQNKLVFSAEDGIHGKELWISDGTEAGTQLIKDVLVGSSGSGAVPYYAFGTNGIVFMANDGVHGNEYWFTDGTEAGTHFLFDSRPGAGDSFGGDGVMMGGHLYFKSYDSSNGYNIYKTDGTTVTPVTSFTNNWSYSSLYALESKVLFITQDAVSGRELFVIDDGSTSASMIELIPGADGIINESNIVVLNNKIVFVAQDSLGENIYSSDGTVMGTSNFVITTGGSSTDYNLTVVGQKIYWFHSDSSGNNEVYVTDGTLSGTRAAISIESLGTNYPSEIEVIDNKIYIRYDDYEMNQHGYWSIDKIIEEATKLCTFSGVLAA